MKVCEFDHIGCPSCGENKPEYKDGAENTFGLKEGPKVVVRGGGIEMRGHLIHCLSCSLDFVIPCED